MIFVYLLLQAPPPLWSRVAQTVRRSEVNLADARFHGCSVLFSMWSCLRASDHANFWFWYVLVLGHDGMKTAAATLQWQLYLTESTFTFNSTCTHMYVFVCLDGYFYNKWRDVMHWSMHSLVLLFLCSTTGKFFRSGSKTVRSPMRKTWHVSCPPKTSIVDAHGLWCLHGNHEFHESFMSHKDLSFHSEGPQTVIPQDFRLATFFSNTWNIYDLPRWVGRLWLKRQQCEVFGKLKLRVLKGHSGVWGRWNIDPKV